MNNKIYQQLMKEANKSLKYNDVPVGALIVKNNKIISKGHNTREKDSKVISHAEINAILKANKKLKSYFLYDCDIYVTLEPCEMCKKVINNSRIRCAYYLLNKDQSKNDYNKTKYILLDNEYSKLSKKNLQIFFDKLR